MWGCVFITSWFVVILINKPQRTTSALFVASVLALEYESVVRASTGRMDMMCVALGLAGLASYFWSKYSNWNRGVVLAAWFGAASLFSHPMGAVMNASIAAMVLLDWRRIRWIPLVSASIPYLIGIACCLYYIHQAPDVFMAQSRASSEYRVRGLSAVLHNILNDASVRYVHYYWEGYTGVFKLRLASLLFLAGGVLGLLAVPRLRSQPVSKRLLFLALISYVGVAVVDSEKFPHYLIFSVPVFMACGAVWVFGQWRASGPSRLIACGLLGASILVTVCGVGYRIYSNSYHNLYEPAAAAVRRSLPPGEIVMGGSELGFELGFGMPLVDDRYLGFFSGQTPAVFVVSEYYAPPWASPV